MSPRIRSLVFAACLVAPAVHAAPCAGFTDVDDTSPFCGNVQWMRNRGITLGCSATLYCPNDFVTRLQMAAFMYRLGFQNAFLNGGNAYGMMAVLGTTDANAVEVHAEGRRVMRFEPSAISPNVVGGVVNGVLPGVRGAAIGGGGVATGVDPALAQGGSNFVFDIYGTVGGGLGNEAGSPDGNVQNAPAATVSGGFLNSASGHTATVAGGNNNAATGSYSSIAGGSGNTVSGLWGAVGGGSGNVVSGLSAMIPGGNSNIATGDASFAAGRNANAGSNGCFVWSDSSHASDETQCGVANAFVARAKGGFYLITGGSFGSYTGAHLAPGATAWTTLSDRAAKENVAAVDSAAILDKVAALPIATWNWRAQDASIRHIGPMAQDFHAAFGLGETPLGISTVDADGVALAAIQGLYAKLVAKDTEIAGLRDRLAALEATVQQLTRRQPAAR